MKMRTEDKLTGICILGFYLFLFGLMLLASSKKPRCTVCGLEIKKGDSFVKIERTSRYAPHQSILMCKRCFENLSRINEQTQKEDTNEQP